MNKYSKLLDYFKELGSVAIAFSGGVDSTLLVYAAHEALGDNAIAITINSNLITNNELSRAKDYCQKIGIKHLILNANEQEIEGFRQNPPNRCYICKKHIFTNVIKMANENGIEYVAEGSNMDDNNDYRPGMVAIKELGVKSPLQMANLHKNEIRQLLKEFNIPIWNMQSAACLASRFEYGDEITPEKLNTVAQAEEVLHSLEFSQYRVRVHKNIARIEVPPTQFDILIQNREMICTKLKSLGFDYVTMDLSGYRMGSMNEVLDK